MSANLNNEDEFRRLMNEGLNAPVPPEARAKLEATYATLGAIAQESSATLNCDNGEASDHAAETGGTSSAEQNGARVSQPPFSAEREGEGVRPAAPAQRTDARRTVGGRRVMRRGAIIAVAAVLVVLLSGAAFAASRLVQMQPGDVPFFETGDNLPVYDSLQTGVTSLQAEVAQSVVADGVTVTLDTVSCDRNIVNLFFTLEKEGGFNLAEQSIYEGSQENEWSRLQRLTPRFSYEITSNGQPIAAGGVNVLDAYQEEDGAVKVMQRIVPEVTLPDQVDIALEGHAFWKPYDNDMTLFTLEAGLDLSTVNHPRELGAQDLVFATSEGEKMMGIQRFTASELGCVMVVRNDNEWRGERGVEGSSYGPPDNVLVPGMVKVTDDAGNVLTMVGAGDGSGYNPEGAQVVEYAGLSPEAKSVTFTPMLNIVDWEAMTPDERRALNDANEQHVDVTQIGSKLATSEFGGYELTGHDVNDGTVSITLKPYGWQAFGNTMELVADDDVTFLENTWTDPDTGETGTGYHSGIMYRKQDYLTGDFIQMVSYYAADDEELRGLTSYQYRSAFNQFREEADAALTASFA